jgi:iron(III) transport system ATP-binding protein
VTHDQDEALSLADQVAVMRHGRLVQAAEPRALYRSPADPEVARFVGGAAVLPGHIANGVATCALGRAPVVGEHPDGPAQVLVRPEQVRLDGPPSSAEVRIEEISFYGHDAAVHLQVLPDGPTLVARVAGLDSPEVGSVVRATVAGPVVAYPSAEVGKVRQT